MSRTIRIILLICTSSASAALISESPERSTTSEDWTVVRPALPEQVAVQPLQPNPFDVTEKAEMGAIDLRPSIAAEAPPEPGGPLIPPQVWIALGLMVASFCGYLWVATTNRI